MQYLNNKCALPLCETVKKVVLNFWWPVAPIKCFELGIKLTHDLTQEPALLNYTDKGLMIAPSLRKL